MCVDAVRIHVVGEARCVQIEGVRFSCSDACHETVNLIQFLEKAIYRLVATCLSEMSRSTTASGISSMDIC